jgi:hypothetical protein
MDYNDVDSRIKRLYLSIDQQYENDVFQHTKTQTEENGDGKFILTIDFTAKHDQNETINRINNMISSLANLKDHLVTKLKIQGGNGQDIENEINKDLALQIILDLNNQEKHGYPLKKTRRSGKDPRIINISKALSPRPGVKATAFIRDPITGAGATNNMAIVIIAEIVDNQGNLIYHLSDLINKSLKAWEEIITKYKLN